MQLGPVCSQRRTPRISFECQNFWLKSGRSNRRIRRKQPKSVLRDLIGICLVNLSNLKDCWRVDQLTVLNLTRNQLRRLLNPAIIKIFKNIESSKHFFLFLLKFLILSKSIFGLMNILDWPRAAAELMIQHENGAFEKLRFLIFYKYWAISDVSLFSRCRPGLAVRVSRPTYFNMLHIVCK